MKEVPSDAFLHRLCMGSDPFIGACFSFAINSVYMPCNLFRIWMHTVKWM